MTVKFPRFSKDSDRSKMHRQSEGKKRGFELLGCFFEECVVICEPVMLNQLIWSG